MAKGRRAKRAIKDRRQFLTGAMIATALSIFNSTLGIVDRLLSWRPAPAPIVLTPAPVAIAVAPGTGGLVFGSTIWTARSKSYCAWQSTVAGTTRPTSAG